MSEARDTQFAGFAELLWKELVASDATNYGDQQRELIARRAYDLVRHTIENVEYINLDRESPEGHVLLIPDMTEWPKE